MLQLVLQWLICATEIISVLISEGCNNTHIHNTFRHVYVYILNPFPHYNVNATATGNLDSLFPW